ncbi:beta-lactamase family protein [Streptomyces durbertensis]|uniref:Beta-lactamase family protein n=1 Tax=Streptomyces durbertensis TaxID=2448886 RepID=A0ABR6EMP6_9ACTN|nr:serine hydrolase domain-containing protein [Streptomyces durbertensis]MBB1246362.1 beta-lactamase family protein [Streptomyces durbertensis]
MNRKHRPGLTALLATAVAVALLTSPLPQAAAETAGRTAPAEDAHPSSPDRSLREDADAVRDAGVTGVAVRLDTPSGARVARSGVADLRTGRPVPPNGYIRLGSTTKTYVATVVLQLVGEGRLSLDDTVERWLPGVVRGNGNDGRRVTVRQLLQHTSGVPDYASDVVPDASAAGYHRHRWTRRSSEERVALAMGHRPLFEPGEGWAYSNTNYVLAGMVIRAVTGRPWEREVRERVLRPLRLDRTFTAGDQPFLPRPHARNHQRFEADGPLTDTTVAYLPFDGDADGSMVGTAEDTNRFFGALLGGRLLDRELLAEMRGTVPVPDESAVVPGTRSGLGLNWTPLSCGGGYWGHSGSGFGYLTWPAATADGSRAVTVTAHSRPGDHNTAVRQLGRLTRLVDRALCEAR